MAKTGQSVCRLTWVDHKTGERRWKKSRYYFSETCKTRMVN